MSKSNQRCLQVLCQRHVQPPRLSSHAAATPLLSSNSARCNDSVALVGVRNLIYLHASINTREVGILVGEIRCSAGDLLSFWVTAWFREKKITPSKGDKISYHPCNKISHKHPISDTALEHSICTVMCRITVAKCFLSPLINVPGNTGYGPRWQKAPYL